MLTCLPWKSYCWWPVFWLRTFKTSPFIRNKTTFEKTIIPPITPSYSQERALKDYQEEKLKITLENNLENEPQTHWSIILSGIFSKIKAKAQKKSQK